MEIKLHNLGGDFVRDVSVKVKHLFLLKSNWVILKVLKRVTVVNLKLIFLVCSIYLQLVSGRGLVVSSRMMVDLVSKAENLNNTQQPPSFGEANDDDHKVIYNTNGDVANQSRRYNNR